MALADCNLQSPGTVYLDGRRFGACFQVPDSSSLAAVAPFTWRDSMSPLLLVNKANKAVMPLLMGQLMRTVDSSSQMTAGQSSLL